MLHGETALQTASTPAAYAAQASRPSAIAVPLGPGQAAALAAWGVFLWFVAALLIRWAPPVLFARGAWTALLFVAALPNAWLTIWVTRRLFSLRADQLVPAAALACAAAMFCDGVALTWTTLYGPGTKDLVPVAALLLWGVAAILIAAFVVAHRDARRA